MMSTIINFFQNPTQNPIYGDLGQQSELTPSEQEAETFLSLIASTMAGAYDFVNRIITSSLSFLGNLVAKITPLITHMSSSMINFFVNLYGVCQQNIHIFYRGVLAASVVASFTSFATGVAEMLEKAGYDFEINKAIAAAKTFIFSLMPSGWFTTSNSDNSEQAPTPPALNLADMSIQNWIKIAIAGIISALIGGLGITSMDNMKELTQSFNMIGSAGRAHSTVQSCADFLLREIVGLELDSDYVAIKELTGLVQEGQYLQNCSSAHFIQHPDDLAKLVKFSENIVKVTSRPISKDASARYNSTRSLLVSMYRTLCDKLATVNAILDTKQRQATAGFLFSGKHAVGKSELCKYMARRIGAVLKYNPAIYTLNKKSEGFFEPYGGQSFGVFNEFMTLMSDDPIIRDFNLIFSSDPMNFEGAALDCKNQPNRLKLAFLTSNIENPDLTRVMNPGAAEAVWDRIYHVRVEDPKCQGRKAPNPHRKPDFSHLQFRKIEHSNLNSHEGEYITLDTLIQRAVGRCASAEMDFIRNILVDEAMDSDTRTKLLERQTELREILRTNNPYDDMGTNVTANGWGREFFTYRFQGVSGGGKTTLCERVAREMSTLFNYEIQYTLSIDEFKPLDKPAIYVFDDWLEAGTPEVFQQYLEKVNHTHRLSIFLICSNKVFTRARTPFTLTELKEQCYAWYEGFQRLQPYDARSFKGPTGVLRRMGLQGAVIPFDDEPITMNEAFSKTFTFYRNFTIKDARGITVTQQSILNQLFSDYRYFTSLPGDILVSKSIPPVIKEPGVSIIANTVSDVIEVLKDSNKMFSAYLGMSKTVKFNISPELIKRATSPQTNLSMWHIPEDTPSTDDAIKELFVRMSVLYARVAPHTALEIRILSTKDIYYYDNHVAYIYNEAGIISSSPVEIRGELLIYTHGINDTRIVSVDDYLAFKINRQFIGALGDLQLPEILAIDRYVAAHVGNPECTSDFKIKYTFKMHELSRNQNSVARRIQASMRAHPVFWIACSLLSFAATTTAIYYLAKQFISCFPDAKQEYSREFLIEELNKTYPDDDFEDYSDEWLQKHYLANKDDRLLPSQANNSRLITRKEGNKFLPVYSNEDSFGNTRMKGSRYIKANEDSFGNTRMKGSRYIKANEDSFGNTRLRNSRLIKTNNSSMEELEKTLKRYTPIIPVEKVVKTIEEYSKSDMVSQESDHYLDQILLKPDTNPFISVLEAQRMHGETPSDNTLVKYVKSNMVTDEEAIPQALTPLESLSPVLARSYYLVINKNGGRCYGLGLQGKLILTVSHMFENEFERLTIQSKGEKYSAQVVKIYRDRDLAVINVDDRTFTPGRSNHRLFQDPAALERDLYGFFSRPIAGDAFMGGYISYYPTTKYPLTDRANQNYKLSEKIIVFCALACNKIRDFVKKGDCGFPLLTANKDGTYRIIGIHNSYSESEKVYFSGVTSDDFLQFCKDATEAIKPNGLPEAYDMCVVTHHGLGEDFLLPKPYVEALEEIQPNKYFPDQESQLDIIGYSPDLAFRSRPNYKGKFMDLPGMQTPVYKIPAAFTMHHVTDSSALVLDSEARPDPLFTQCVKYDKRVGYGYNPDTLALAAERVMEDMYARYGDCRWLRMHEVINGVVDGALAGFDPTTSAGPLLKMTHEINNKLHLLKAAPNEHRRVLCLDMSHPAAVMVENHYNTYVRSLINGGPPPMVISKDCAKVELLDATKAAAGKVRLFNEIDFSINMVLKKFFGDLQNKVIDTHLDNPIKMGMNPYKAATRICKDFNRLDGKVVSTDFSGFDKQIPSILIYIFCRTAARCYHSADPNLTPEEIDKLYDSLYLTLTFSLHTCRGTIYAVDRGNESGTFVTTILNSVAVRTLTLYTLIRKWEDIFMFTPTLKDLLTEYEEVIYGDDRAFKTSSIFPVTQQEVIDDSALFGLKCTPAKTSGEIDFCSRSLWWNEVDQIAYPALKIESVLSQIRWFQSLDRTQVIDNIDNCLFEAALHPTEDVFELALKDARVILKHLGIPMSDIQFVSRRLIRQRFRAYVLETADYAWLTHHASRGVLNEQEYYDSVVQNQKTFALKREQLLLRTESRSSSVREEIRRLQKYFRNPTAIMPNPETNPVSAVLEALTACKITAKPVDVYTQHGAQGFELETSLLGQTVRGSGASKKSAKFAVYSELYHRLNELRLLTPNAETSNTLADARKDASAYAKEFLYKSIEVHLEGARGISAALKRPVCVLSKDHPNGHDDTMHGWRFKRGSDGEIYVLSSTAQALGYNKLHNIYHAQPGTSERGCKIFVSVDEQTANMDPGVHTQPSLVGDTVTNPGLTTIPHIANVVPVTETAPAMVNNDPPAMSAYEPFMPQMNLNPSGPPNMLSAGAIGFDIKDLAYNQFMDCDEMQTFSDSTNDGGILFQIPYDPMSKWVNRYAQSYVKLHSRYAGDMEFRFTVVGNQTFSGFIGLCWYPNKFEGVRMPLSEAMKYNYVAESINQPFSCIFRLGDARQDKFWRSIADKDDVDSRPHLVCFVMLTAVSPLREGITVRIRVASKLCANFQVSNPILGAETGPTTTPALGFKQDVRRLLGQPLLPNIVRPYMILGDSQFHLVIDGNTFIPSIDLNKTDYIYSAWPYPSAGAEPVKIDKELTTSTCVPPVVVLCKLGGKEGEDRQVTQMVYFNFNRCTRFLSDYDGIKNFIMNFANGAKVDATALNTFADSLGAKFVIHLNKTSEPLKSQFVEVGTGGSDQTFFSIEWVHCNFVFQDGAVDIFTIIPPTDAMVVWHPDKAGEVPLIRTLLISDPKQTQVQSVYYPKGAEAMPAGWRHLAITPDLPFVAVEALVASYTPTHPSLVSLIKYLDLSISSTQCLQIVLSDYESARSIATIRYLPDRQLAVVNLGDDERMYGTSLRPCERMFVSEISVVERTTQFPVTAFNGNFADNQIHPDVAARNFRAIRVGF